MKAVDINYIIDKINCSFPIHAKKIKKNLRQGILDIHEAELFFKLLHHYAHSQNKNIDYIIECYNHMLKDMLLYRQQFLLEGRYANTSFLDVEKKVYDNPAVMDYHMHGLLLAQFLWPDQFYRLKFFKQQLKTFPPIQSYLEIGAGHGLYVKEVLHNFPQIAHAEIIDISETSIKICKALVQSQSIHFKKENLLDLEETRQYDFISIAEVIEHLEDPAMVLQKVKRLLNKNGFVFLSTPVNSPMIDHIFLFSSIDEIKELIAAAGFMIVKDTFKSSEDLSYESSLQLKVPVMYAAFLKISY